MNIVALGKIERRVSDLRKIEIMELFMMCKREQEINNVKEIF